MKLLIINPSEAHYDRGLNIDPEVSRLIEMIRNLRDHLVSVDVILEKGGMLDLKLYRTLLGDIHEKGGPDFTLRRMLDLPARHRNGSAVRIPTRRKAHTVDPAMVAWLQEGEGTVLVAGFDGWLAVKPTLVDLLPFLGSRMVVVQNCVGSQGTSQALDFLEYCKDAGIKCMVTSDIVREAWKGATH